MSSLQAELGQPIAKSPGRLGARLGDLESDVHFQLHQLRGTLQSSAAMTEQEIRQREAVEILLRTRMGDFETQLRNLSSEMARLEQVGTGHAKLIEELSERIDSQRASSSAEAQEIRASFLEHISHVREDLNSIRCDQRSMRTTLSEHMVESSERSRKQKDGLEGRLEEQVAHVQSKLEEERARTDGRLEELSEIVRQSGTEFAAIIEKSDKGIIDLRTDAFEAARERSEVVQKSLEAQLAQVQVMHQTQIVADRQSTHDEFEAFRQRVEKLFKHQEDRLDEAQQAMERNRSYSEAQVSRQIDEVLGCIRREIAQAASNVSEAVERKTRRLHVEVEELRSTCAVERNLHEETSLQVRASSTATEQLRAALEELCSAEHARGLKSNGHFAELDEQQRAVSRRLNQVGVELTAHAATAEELKRQVHQEIRANAEATVALAEQQANSKKELVAWHREAELRAEGVAERQKETATGLKAELAISRQEQQKVHALALEAYRAQKEQSRLSDAEVERKLERCIQALHLGNSTPRWRS